MKIIICLGNPGAQYAATRHNVGVMVGDTLIRRHGFDKVGAKFKSIVYEGMLGVEKVWVVFPQTYMNLSGEVVQLVKGFFKLEDSEILIVYDDFDIPFLSIRFRPKGSAGTHNGLRSIVQLTGSHDFPRIRVGIGPKPPEFDVSSFVLSKFSESQAEHLPDVLNAAVDVAELFVKDLQLAKSQGSRTLDLSSDRNHPQAE